MNATDRMLREWPWLTDEQRVSLRAMGYALDGEYANDARATLIGAAIRFAVQNAGIPITPPAPPAPPKQQPPDSTRLVLAFFKDRTQWTVNHWAVAYYSCGQWIVPIFGGGYYPGKGVDPVVWQELPPAPKVPT